jgi:hypothetical protein
MTQHKKAKSYNTWIDFEMPSRDYASVYTRQLVHNTSWKEQQVDCQQRGWQLLHFSSAEDQVTFTAFVAALQTIQNNLSLPFVMFYELYDKNTQVKSPLSWFWSFVEFYY